MDLANRPTVTDFDDYLTYLERVWHNALGDKGKADDLYWRRNDLWAEY